MKLTVAHNTHSRAQHTARAHTQLVHTYISHTNTYVRVRTRTFMRARHKTQAHAAQMQTPTESLCTSGKNGVDRADWFSPPMRKVTGSRASKSYAALWILRPQHTRKTASTLVVLIANAVTIW